MSIEYPPFFVEHLELFLNSLHASHGITWLLEYGSVTETYIDRNNTWLNKQRMGIELFLNLNGIRGTIGVINRKYDGVWLNVFDAVAVALFGEQRGAFCRHKMINCPAILEFVALLAQIIRDRPVPVTDITVAAKLQVFADKYAPLEV